MSTQDSFSTDDLRIEGIRPLASPSIVMEALPLTKEASKFVSDARTASENILAGKDDRLLVVVGPCSIHDEKAALEYAEKLSHKIKEYEDDLVILMRVYFEKPRTTVGWKGYINDPDLDDTFEINEGLNRARDLLRKLTNIGVASGTEFLDAITPQYIADIVAWGAIGARTTESQVHRQLASGLSMPVGFKNGTDGNIKIAIDAIGASAGGHHFLSVTKQGVAAIVTTKGNDSCHVILRGASSGPNYQSKDVEKILTKLKEANLPPYLMIDCSHGNSLKDHKNQPKVCDDIANQISNGETGIAGVMIESHLVEGKQGIAPPEDLTYGQSITDACVHWEDTEKMLDTLAKSVKARRDQ